MARLPLLPLALAAGILPLALGPDLAAAQWGELPDFVVDSVFVSPAPPVAEQRAVVTCGFRNVGGPANHVLVTVEVAGVERSAYALADASRASFEILVPTPGTHPVRCEVNRDQAVREADRAANVLDRSYAWQPAQLPDVVVSGIRHSPDPAVAGQAVTVDCTLQNVGAANVETTIQGRISVAGQSRAFGFSGLPAGRSMTVRQVFDGVPAGAHALSCLANEGRSFRESNYDNSGLTKTLQVLVPRAPDPQRPDYEVVSLRTLPDPPVAGENATAICAFVNKGSAPSTPTVQVAFVRADGMRQVVAAAAPAPLAQATARATLREEDAGGHPLTCAVLADEASPEQSYSSNEARVLIQWRVSAQPEANPGLDMRIDLIDLPALRTEGAGEVLLACVVSSVGPSHPMQKIVVRASLDDAYQGQAVPLDRPTAPLRVPFTFRDVPDGEHVVGCAVDPEGLLGDVFPRDNALSRSTYVRTRAAAAEPSGSWRDTWLAVAIFAVSVGTILVWLLSHAAGRLMKKELGRGQATIDGLAGFVVPTFFSLATAFPFTADSAWWGWGILGIVSCAFAYMVYEVARGVLR